MTHSNYNKTNDCLLVGISRYVPLRDKIAFILAIQDIYKEGCYSIESIKSDGQNLFAIKYKESPVGQMYEDLSEAISVFLKLIETKKEL